MREVQVRVKYTVGESSLEFEGSESLYKETFNDLLDKLSAETESAQDAQSYSTATNIGKHGQTRDLGIIEVCGLLNVNSGPSIALAAIVKLALIDRMQSVSRKAILNEINDAHGYQKPSYKSNLGTNLKRLVDRNEVIQESKDTYALSANGISRYSKLLEIT